MVGAEVGFLRWDTFSFMMGAGRIELAMAGGERRIVDISEGCGAEEDKMEVDGGMVVVVVVTVGVSVVGLSEGSGWGEGR